LGVKGLGSWGSQRVVLRAHPDILVSNDFVPGGVGVRGLGAVLRGEDGRLRWGGQAGGEDPAGRCLRTHLPAPDPTPSLGRER